MIQDDRPRKQTARSRNPSPWIAAAVPPPAEIDNLHQRLILGICQALDCEAGAIFLLREPQAELIVCKAAAKSTSRLAVELNQEASLLERSARNKDSILVNDRDILRAGLAPVIPHLPVNALLAAPLWVEETPLGAVAAFNPRKRAFSLIDQEILEKLALPIAESIHQARRSHEFATINASLESSIAQLTRSRNTLRALFDNIPISIYIIDAKYNLIAANQARAQRTNRAPNLLVGQPCYQGLYQREEPCANCRVMDTLTLGKPTVRAQRQREGNEEPQEWEIGAYPICDDMGQVIQAILIEQDMTDKHRLETIVAQSEKLAAIGQLAAGVAHEINNPLTAILANAQLLQREIPPGDDKQELVGMISRAGARAAQVVRSLLDLARLEQYEFLPTDINETVRKALELVKHEIMSHSIELITDLPDSLPRIRASQSHLQGIWVNLLVNAIDALEDAGGSENAGSEKPIHTLRVSTRYTDQEIHISIADNGKGIPPERLQRIFDPFYTTKSVGRGTGLGLSVCDRIVKQHGGHIRVKSQLGVGTEFTVILPAG